ncbi:MAG: hypothetical protein ABFD54_12835 [Armatimonadota bacterium]|nr:hypothetical protein [bacterium]
MEGAMRDVETIASTASCVNNWLTCGNIVIWEFVYFPDFAAWGCRELRSVKDDDVTLETLLQEFLGELELPYTLSGATIYPSWKMPLLFHQVAGRFLERQKSQFAPRKNEVEVRLSALSLEPAELDRARRIVGRIYGCMGKPAIYYLDGEPQPYTYQWWPILHCLDLEQAIQYLGVKKALTLFENTSLPELAVRASFFAFLHCGNTPLYTLDELADLLDQFADYLTSNRNAVLETGYPGCSFAQSFWLGNQLGRLYFAAFPNLVITPLENPANQSYLFLEESEEQRDEAPEDAVPIFGANYKGAVRKGDFIYLPQWKYFPDLDEQGNMLQCKGWITYHERKLDNTTHTLILEPEQFEHLVTLREKVLSAKQCVLQLLAAALRKRDANNLLDRCLDVMSEKITADEMEFLFSIDRLFSLYSFDRCYGSYDANTLPAGGVSDILTLVGHCQKEIEIGTYAAICEEMRGLLSPNLAYPRLLAGNYYEIIEKEATEELEKAYGIIQSNYHDELRFWDNYIGQVNDIVAEEFMERVVIEQLVKRKHVNSFIPKAKQVTDYIRASMELTGDTPHISTSLDAVSSAPHAKECDCIFQQHGDMWTVRFSGDTKLVRDLDGMHYIKLLLESPGNEFRADQLYYLVHPVEFKQDNSPNKLSMDELISEYQVLQSIGTQISDPEDYKEFKFVSDKRQLCKEELLDAIEAGDQKAAAALREKVRALDDFITSHYDHKGRSRTVSDPLKNQRQTVSKSIVLALKKMKKIHPSLADHLRSIKTGTYCSYDGGLDWQTDDAPHADQLRGNIHNKQCA